MPLIKKAPPPPAASDTKDWRTQMILLQTGTPDERWGAARALAEAPEAVGALDAALVETTDSRLREAIFTSLSRQNTAGFGAILRHLRSDDAELRSLALDAMRLMPKQTSQRLPSLLEDDDPDIRVLACELARQMPSGEAATLLAALIDAERQVNVCAAALEVLAEIGGPPELVQIAGCAARFPSEFFLDFSAKTASERIRARIGA